MRQFFGNFFNFSWDYKALQDLNFLLGEFGKIAYVARVLKIGKIVQAYDQNQRCDSTHPRPNHPVGLGLPWPGPVFSPLTQKCLPFRYRSVPVQNGSFTPAVIIKRQVNAGPRSKLRLGVSASLRASRVPLTGSPPPAPTPHAVWLLQAGDGWGQEGRTCGSSGHLAPRCCTEGALKSNSCPGGALWGFQRPPAPLF